MSHEISDLEICQFVGIKVITILVVFNKLQQQGLVLELNILSNTEE